MADQPQKHGDEGTSRVTKRRGKRAKSESSSAPCGACKYLRRRCVNGCIFAPFFGSHQGSARFAIVHKVFGAGSVSRMLSDVEEDRRHEAMVSIYYEAQARLANPINGCLSTIFTLQQQVASLQGELGLVQNQLINSRIAYATLLQSTQQQPNINVAVQPAYSNNAPTSTNFMNMSCFNTGFDHLTMQTTQSSHSLEPLQFSGLLQHEEESRIPYVFNNDIAHLIP